MLDAKLWVARSIRARDVDFKAFMVGVAQLAERKNVALEVAGSNPVTHPILYVPANPKKFA